MDAISSLRAGMQVAQATVDRSAAQLASAGLPTASSNPSEPVSAANQPGVDVAEQLTTMMVAADTHHLTTAAIRVALSMYEDAASV